MISTAPRAEPPVLLSYREASRLMGITTRTLGRMIAGGHMPIVRVTPTLPRVDRRDLERFIADAKFASKPRKRKARA